jgi:ABC-type multidrug transport system fused ATPase/permease subunit
MKNFARLVRFAWPYRVRFGLSLGCAAMVALLWFTELGAVYPLLQILFNSQNCQKWVAEKIDAIETEIEAVTAQLDELDAVEHLAPGDDPRPPKLVEHFQRRDEAFDRVERALRELERKVDTSINRGPKGQPAPADQARLMALRREHRVAGARLGELRRASNLVRDGDRAGLVHRRARLGHDLAENTRWLGRYQWLQPRVNRYLPDESFKTLLLLLALVMTGVAVKGLFLFLQEVLVAKIMQRSLFDIRNLFFRRTMALDLASFSDQGSAELMSRFTNDMDSFSQGLNTLLSKMIREPLRVVTCLGGALWLNWRLTCLAMVLVPVSAATTYRAGKIMKQAVRRLAREHVEHLQDPPGDAPGDRGRQGLRDGAARAAQVLPRDQEPVQEERPRRPRSTPSPTPCSRCSPSPPSRSRC